MSEIRRRTILANTLALALTGCVSRDGVTGYADAVDALRRIERRARGRLGAYILDPNLEVGFGWRANERFAHCSSFKMSLAAMVLAKADRGEIDLTETLRWTAKDMLFTSPVTTADIDKGLSVKDLAQATLVTSDNTAANVLLRRFGGPPELTRFWRSLGDDVSRIDRYEPQLNVTPPGTELDTTTPAAMAKTTAALIHGNALAPESRATLKAWMIDVRTGLNRVRAGFPPSWEAGDKTGTWVGDAKNTYVDLAFGGPAGQPQVVVAAYFEPAELTPQMSPAATAVLADVGRVAVTNMNGRSPI